jgi:sugar/nucleoside kinase (ribokinase family)
MTAPSERADVQGVLDAWDVVVLADLNPDLLLSGPGVVPAFGQVERLIDDARLALGGSGSIFATGASRLGLRTAVVGLVGDDPFGLFVLERLAAAGVNSEGVVVDAATSTGLTVVLNRGADRAILTHLGAIGRMTAQLVDRSLLAGARHVHVASYFLQRGLQTGLPGLLREARAGGATTSLDTNWDPDERWSDGIGEVLEEVDVLLPNEAEACALGRAATLEEAVASLAGCVPDVVVKRGALGGYASTAGRLHSASTPTVDVVDTTGAGDSFDAGYIFGLLRGLSPEDRLRAACVCGALSTRGVGGTAAQPDEAELRRWLTAG